MKNKIAWIVIGILMVLTVSQTYKGYMAKRERDQIVNKLVESDSLTQETNIIYSQVAHENAILAKKNQDLLNLLKKRNERLHQYTHIVGEYKEVSIRGNAEAKAIIDSLGQKKIKVIFQGEEKGVRVIGWTETPSPTFQVNVFRPPLILDVLTAQEKGGSWKTYVNTNDPYLMIKDIKTEIKPLIDPWYRNFYLSGEVGFVPNIGMIANIGGGYKSWGLSMIFIQGHQGFAIQRKIKL